MAKKLKSKILPSSNGHAYRFQEFRNRVYPLSSSQDIPTSEDKESKEKKQAIFEKFDQVTKTIATASKWRNLSSKRRTIKREKSLKRLVRKDSNDDIEQFYGGLNSVINGIDSEYESSEAEEEEEVKKVKSLKISKASSKALIIYFAKLARGLSEKDELDLDFIEGLLDNGADVNSSDRHGQTVLHETSRAWHTDVAKFLLKHGADINKADKYGRTPLHIASAVNYPEMVTFLINNGGMILLMLILYLLTYIHFIHLIICCPFLS